MNKEQLLELMEALPPSAEEITITGVTSEKIGFSVPHDRFAEMTNFPRPYRVILHPRGRKDVLRIMVQ